MIDCASQGVVAYPFTAGLPDSADEITSRVTFSEGFEVRLLHLIEREAVKLALALRAKRFEDTWTSSRTRRDRRHADDMAKQRPHHPDRAFSSGESRPVVAFPTDRSLDKNPSSFPRSRVSDRSRAIRWKTAASSRKSPPILS